MGPVCAGVADGRAVERLAEALLVDGHWEVRGHDFRRRIAL